MRLLAIETATEACSAAVHVDGRVFSRFELAPQRHAELILPMCEAVLADAGLTLGELDLLAFGRGPGAFTGVRIATGVIQGIALGTGLQVIGISSLAALAQSVVRNHSAEAVFAAIDARMGEIYCASFRTRAGLIEPEGIERVVPAGDVAPLPPGHWCGAGTGFATYAPELREGLGTHLGDIFADAYPHAEDVLTLALAANARGEAVDAARALPVYLRDRVV
jgi:tRNA threonylcarbamoyladenosine biosynthesis protein TsaB